MYEKEDLKEKIILFKFLNYLIKRCKRDSLVVVVCYINTTFVIISQL